MPPRQLAKSAEFKSEIVYLVKGHKSSSHISKWIYSRLNKATDKSYRFISSLQNTRQLRIISPSVQRPEFEHTSFTSCHFLSYSKKASKRSKRFLRWRSGHCRTRRVDAFVGASEIVIPASALNGWRLRHVVEKRKSFRVLWAFLAPLVAGFGFVVVLRTFWKRKKTFKTVLQLRKVYNNII